MSTPAAFCYLSWQSWHWFPLIVWLVNVYPSEHQENTEGNHGATGTGNKSGKPFQTELDTTFIKILKDYFWSTMQVLVPSHVDRINKVLAWLAKAVPQNLVGQLNLLWKIWKGFLRANQETSCRLNWAEQGILAGDVFFTRLATVWLVWFCLICGVPCSEIIPEPAGHPVSRTLEVEDSQYGAWIHWSVKNCDCDALSCTVSMPRICYFSIFQYASSSLDQRVWKMPHWLRCPKIRLKIQNCNSHLGWSGMDQFKMAGLVYRFYIT